MLSGLFQTQIQIRDNFFANCSAYVGGAIAFDNKQPLLRNNSFESNIALLSGNNKASYPQSLQVITTQDHQDYQQKLAQINTLDSTRFNIDNTSLTTLIKEYQAIFISQNTRSLSESLAFQKLFQENEARLNQLRALSQPPSNERGVQSSHRIKSGSIFDPIYLALYDNYDNIIFDPAYPSRSLQARVQISNGSKFPGIITNYKEPDESEGIFVVQGVRLTAEPDTTVELIFTASLDPNKDLSNISVSASQFLRIKPCQEGEAFLDTGQCLNCDPGTYLLEAPTGPLPCLECPQNAVCYGSNKIGPVKGYWRSSASSINFIQCFNKDACQGTSEAQGEYYPEGTCANGYKGILCAQCEQNYVRNGSFQCAKCPPAWQNFVLLFAVLIGAIFVLVILIKVTLSSMKEMKSPFSAYFKIMTNHLHLILLTASFDLSWPQVISDFFSSTEPVANVADRIISIDCFMDASAFNRVPRPYMYLLIYLFMPFFIVLVSLAIWGFIYPRKRVTMCNRTITTSIILLFLVHPSITTLLIRVFHCYKIDDDFHLVHDLELQCWTPSHLSWALGGALPGILLWGIGIPLAALLLLYCSRDKLESPDMKPKYGFLYNGYRHRLYYWESVIMFRKVAMIFITVFLSSLGRIVQALSVILLLIFYLFYTIRKKPYTTRRLNELEIISLLTSSTTIYCGVFFLSSRETTDPSFTPNVDMTLSEETKWILVCVILISNLIFLTLWIYFFFKDVRFLLANKFPRVFRCCCLCCHYKRWERSKLQINKAGQDSEVINLIEDVESELSRIKYKYVFNRKFEDKWEFEDYLKQVDEKLGHFNTHPMKLEQYRKKHSLEESEARFERSTNSKNVRISSHPSCHHFGFSSENINTRGAKEEEMMVDLNSIRPQLEHKRTSHL